MEDKFRFIFRLFSPPLEKLMPHNLSTLPSPILDLEEVRERKMKRRAKVIKELVQTEKDYLTDLELCIREVVQPLRKLQVDAPQSSSENIFLRRCLLLTLASGLLDTFIKTINNPDTFKI